MRRILLSALLLALVSVPALAVVNGPVNPPPGGASNVPSGNIRSAIGLTRTMSAFDFSNYDRLFYGPPDAGSVNFSMDGNIDEPGETLLFNLGASNLATGTLVYTGVTDIETIGTNPVVNTRLVIQFAGAVGPGLLGSSVGRPDVPALGEILGNCTVNLKLQAFWSGSWQDVNTVYAQANTPAGAQDMRTDVTALFFYETNELEAILEALDVLEAKLDAVEVKLDTNDPRLDQIVSQTTQIGIDTQNLIFANQAIESKLDNAGFQQIQEMLQLLVELSAEKALLEKKRIATIHLPLANNGALELVRQLLESKIDDVEAAGENSNSARYYMGLGDNEVGFGRLKRAFNHYSRAYCEAVKILGERCPQ